MKFNCFCFELAFITICTIVLVLLVNSPMASSSNNNNANRDLYTILGVKRTATTQEIRSAYRAKARDTHPDKRQGDADIAVIEFRAVVEAYETLSDATSRKNYDLSGKTINEQQNDKNRNSNNNNNNNQWQWQWHWQWDEWSQQRHRQQYQQRQMHRNLYNPYRRKQILSAQSRIVSLSPTMQHITSVLFGEEDYLSVLQSDLKLDKYVLIAFYDSSYDNELDSCSHMLHNQVLYPWPFAGYSEESEVSGVWWEDLMIVTKIDLNNRQNRQKDREGEKKFNELLDKFGLDIDKVTGKLRQRSCPMIAMLQRGEGLVRNIPKAKHFSISEDFTKWVWSQLKVKIFIKNLTPWPLTIYWLDGRRGKVINEALSPSDGLDLDTFLSHSFHARAAHVTGYTLTNESGLFWHTVRAQDDQKLFEINSRCFDLSGECGRWKSEGFCDPKSDTFYTRQNPSFRSFAIANCEVSCQVGCGKPNKPQQSIKQEL